MRLGRLKAQVISFITPLTGISRSISLARKKKVQRRLRKVKLFKKAYVGRGSLHTRL